MNYIETSTGKWEVVIGLEVHAQIISATKLFSAASTKFGDAHNENVSFLDAALPGTLPTINSFCIDQAIKTGLGLNGNVNLTSSFDRKNYFYADLPHGYQITQFYHPLISDGYVEIEADSGETKKVRLDHIHIEQDAGKSIHDMSPVKSFIDLNRSGVGLMEIVTRPDMRSAAEAAMFLRKLRSILRYLKTCDGNMDEGSMRADVNVSVHRPDTEYGTRTEVKNVNSVKFLTVAINFEAERQIAILESGDNIKQETRLFDSSTGKTKSMRSKENAQDYRYFPESDLPPLQLELSRVAAIQKTIPELPDAKMQRLQRDYGLSHYDASLLASEKELADYYERALCGFESDRGLAKILANWILGELFALLNRHNKTIEQSEISPERLRELASLITTNMISGKIAKDTLEIMWETKKPPLQIVEENDWRQIIDESIISKHVAAVLVTHSTKVAEYKSGKDKLFGFFVGQAMKAMNGKTHPQLLNDILQKLLDA
ncbi:MAG: Asp-tRNA(Asn)/Glu-tRNA(Gln) amidotransferase subunit GatB [Holosporaceae bacterium]|jgi:aspartyl-tRNA(Asn)/glutamyl-tRNA(Gln) amidotransferase subunit B|nr:Asp-tRNA(Asn)/Glu-tRNA(Gln) amidotransferase subunit GatB [Holosporaceae bacterium]